MASSSQNPSAKYDVFISFRGEDVRHGFLSHLKTKLNQKDINAFVDDRLETGEKISPALLRAIEKSNSSLVIFSENYASSTWCLDELVKIIECMNEKEHIVIPVFLEIDPSIVRHQKGSYKDAFDQHKKRHNKEMMQLWRSALIEAASISGIHYSKSSSSSPKDEAELVENIAEKILFRKLSSWGQNKNKNRKKDLMNTNIDVFISFSSKDVSRFLIHLETKLKQKGIDAFVDDGLESGDKISSARFRAIEMSKISLVIFSENYAESTRCLEELAKIVDCMNTKKHIVFTVFHKIHRSIVKHQIGPYKVAFDQHEKRHKEKVQLWRSALLVAANLYGLHLLEFSSSPEDEVNIVEIISEILFRKLKGDSSTTCNLDGYGNSFIEAMMRNMEIRNNNNADQNKNKESYLSSSHLAGGSMIANRGPQPQYHHYCSDYMPYPQIATTIPPTMNAMQIGTQPQCLGLSQMPPQFFVEDEEYQFTSHTMPWN